MTREEAKKILEIFKQTIPDTSATDSERLIICDALDMAIKALEQGPKAQWVPVSERLPDENGKYLVTQNAFGHKVVCIAYYGTKLSKDHPCWYDYDSEYGYYEVYDIIAWMPLPEPYKEG